MKTVEANERDEAKNPLLEPFDLGDLSLRNRIVMAPLTRTRANNLGHLPTGLVREYYQQRASSMTLTYRTASNNTFEEIENDDNTR